MESSEAKDGFSFRPHRQKRETPISPPRQQQHHHHYNKRRTPNLRHNMGSEVKKYPLLEYTDVVQVQMEAQDHFKKSFTFSPPSPGWKLPSPHTMYTAPIWQKEELQEMKASLNAVKQQLGTKDVAVWHAHTTNTNPSQRVCHAIKRHAYPEMLTQAWLKFYEIVNGYPLVPAEEEGDVREISLSPTMVEESRATFSSVHLCEAPGAFISALNHYLTLNHPKLKWQWLGNTLNPYYEDIPLSRCVVDDRLIIHTLENWCFGTDNTGDLTKQNNLCDLMRRADHLGSVKLVTADGSFDCQADPAEQEKMTHPLHLCEAAAALSILAPGGSLVLKKFTLFESETVCLMYLLCCVFKDVHVYKPATSKQGNSEVYIIALNYCGKDHFREHLEKVVEAAWCGNQVLQTMFQEEMIPEDFMEQVKECSSKFMAYQTQSIKRNLLLFEDMSERQKQLNELLKAKATTLYFERNYCAPIPKWQTLTHGLANQSRQLLESDWNKVSSSLLMRSHSLSSKVEVLTNFLIRFTEDFVDSSRATDKEKEYCMSSFIPQDMPELKFEVVSGKPLQCIESSKFCSERILRLTRELQVLWEMKTTTSKVLELDESLAACVLTHHPGATLVRGEGALRLHPGCQALEQVAGLLEGELLAGASVVVVSAPLLSRLQYGILLALASAFREVLVYRSCKVGSKLPIVVLEGLRSREAAVAVVEGLQRMGWDRMGGGVHGKGFLQVVALQSLLQDQPLMSIYHYNVHLCAHLAQMLLLGIKSPAEN